MSILHGQARYFFNLPEVVLSEKIMKKNRQIVYYVLIFISAFGSLTIETFSQLPLIQHLDAMAEGSIVTNGSNEVTEWKDQTTYNNNAIPLTGSVYKLQDGSLSWLDFGTDRNVMQLFTGSGSDIWLDQSTGSGGFCVILSFKTNSLNSDWNDVIGNSSVVSTGFGLRYSNSGTIKAYRRQGYQYRR